MHSELHLLQDFLDSVKEQKTVRKERTLFSLGGRGYYENPASDLLAFFLKPDGEHGFGVLFLRAFFEAAGFDVSGIDLGDATVKREVPTKEGKLIDFVVSGSNWVLLIENKIYHSQVNPFPDYERYGREIGGGREPLCAILSPGTSKIPGWRGVSYSAYFSVVRRDLAEWLFNQDLTKWGVFAREFILHIESELYQPATFMKDSDAAFVERNAESVARVKNLSAEYRSFLLSELKTALNAALPEFGFTTQDQGWAVRCRSELWGGSNLAFHAKAFGGDHERFKVTVYLQNLNDQQTIRAHAAFTGLEYWSERGGWHCWRTEPGFSTRVDTIAELCRLAGKVAEILPIGTTPSQYPQPVA